MSIQKEAKRVKAGQSLSDFKNQVDSAVDVLQGAKANLQKLKADMGNDSDFTNDDVIEVQNMIDIIMTRIKSI